MERHNFLLCIPQGGINDMMTQIKYCLDYCVISGRECIIDTKRNKEFEHSIVDFFDISHSHISPMTTTAFYKYIEENPLHTIHPPCIKSINIASFSPVYSVLYQGFLFEDIYLKVDKERIYTENVVVHSTCGGGIAAQWFLNSFPPKPILLDELRRRYAELGPEYLAVHIRNTDYKSDVSGFLAQNDTLLRSASTVFLASDNLTNIQFIKNLYGDKIKTFSKLMEVTDACNPQHKLVGKPPSFVIDSFCDLILLGLSTTYIHSNSPSGYSRNARYLHQDPEFRSYYKRLLSGV